MSPEKTGNGAADAGKEEKVSPPAESPMIETRLGVWRILQPTEPHMLLDLAQAKKSYQEFIVTFASLRRFLADIFRLGPSHLLVCITGTLWNSLETAITLIFSQKLLKAIENGVTTSSIDRDEVIRCLAIYLICRAITSIVSWLLAQVNMTMQQRVNAHFEAVLLQAQLRLDLPTAEDSSSSEQFSHIREVWYIFSQLLDMAESLLMAASQLVFVYNVTRTENSITGRFIFPLLCAARPLFRMFLEQSLWDKSYIAHAVNESYVRMMAIKQLATSSIHRKELLSDGLGPYLLQEYEKAREELGDISYQPPTTLYAYKDGAHTEVASSLVSELPMVFYAARSLYDPKTFSVASLYVLQQVASELRWTFYRLLENPETLLSNMRDIQRIYESLKIKNKNQDGEVAYPPPDSVCSPGMEIEFRDVTFEYPGTQTSKKALSNVSFTLKPGQLVVVVGSNGSGKSSMVKLLGRLYEPTSGKIYIDGRPAEDYRVADLRQATATLSQDHTIFPLSIEENIRLGLVNGKATDSDIEDAARRGGAYDFISKYDVKFSTVLRPPYTLSSSWKALKEGSSLKAIYDSLEKGIEVSGGEKQRLVASRTFMRLSSSSVKLLVVDEPSSALDPEGEYQLFEGLRESRKGKTMVFVTHRFGHLTKYADLILCMKDGKLAEAGTHDELITLDGDYAKLYNVQAQAFVS